jgi:hypothetical protein
MPVNRFSKRVTLALAAISVLFLLGFVRQSRGDKERDPEQVRIQRGFEITPVPLNLGGKDRNLVGLGSYIVNTSGCIDCHTWESVSWRARADQHCGLPGWGKAYVKPTRR